MPAQPETPAPSSPRSPRRAASDRSMQRATLIAAVALQVALGIANVLHGAPLPEALAHQLGAVALFVLVIRARHHARYPYETSVRGTIR